MYGMVIKPYTLVDQISMRRALRRALYATISPHRRNMPKRWTKTRTGPALITSFFIMNAFICHWVLVADTLP